MSGIQLAEVIQDLREELAKAIADGRNHRIRFKPGNIDVELSVDVRKSVEGKAGVKFWVVEAGATGTTGQTQAHKIKLSLSMVDERGREILISGDPNGRPGDSSNEEGR